MMVPSAPLSPETSRSPWWKLFPAPSKNPPVPPDPAAVPVFRAGDVVRIAGKPEKARKVWEARWHRYRARYVYVVETAGGFEAYWFEEQLIRDPGST